MLGGSSVELLGGSGEIRQVHCFRGRMAGSSPEPALRPVFVQPCRRQATQPSSLRVTVSIYVGAATTAAQ